MSNYTPAPPTPTKAYKAVLTFVGTVIVSLYMLTKDRTDLDTLGVSGWVSTIIAAVAMAIGVYALPNPPK